VSEVFWVVFAFAAVITLSFKWFVSIHLLSPYFAVCNYALALVLSVPICVHSRNLDSSSNRHESFRSLLHKMYASDTRNLLV